MTDPVVTAMQTATAAYRRIADRAAGADRAAVTGLAGWTVGDLVDHVRWGASMEADAVRAAAGLPAEPASTLDAAVDAFDQAASLPVDPGAMIALAAGTVPLAYAAPLFAFEAALHDVDLAHALDVPAGLSDDELAACAVVLGPMLDLVAAVVPDGDITIDLLGLGDGVRLHAADGGWRRGVPDGRPATTAITGNAHDIVLFVCGRAGAAVRVDGDRLHAARFKEYFPGP